jgi:chaperonin GroES
MINPLGSYVIVKRAAAEQSTGIIIPDAFLDKPDLGEVIAVGPKATNVKAGDKVLFGTYSGKVFTLDEQELIAMDRSDLFAVIQCS